MKYHLITLSLLFTIISFGQEVKKEHFCSKGKIEAFSKLKTINHKSIAGQEKFDLNYVKLDLTLDNLSTTIDQGYAQLKGIVTAFTMDVVVLELDPNLIIDSAKVNGVSVSFNRTEDKVEFFLASNLSSGATVITEIFYHGSPQTTGGFFGGIFNATSQAWGARVTWTLSQPFSAHTWWPCKQVLTDKIDSSEVWLTVPNNLKGGSNGVLQNETSLANNKTRFEWKHQHPIDYYLISMAVGPYIEYSYLADLPGTNSTVEIQNYIYDNPNTLIDFQADIEETGDMMFFFSEIFGLYPYANEKYGHCMAPLNGGMEHQTMTTQGFFERTLTAHELGHQWFGDHVTCESWGHIWVNEGFASYSEYLYLQTLNQNSAQQWMVAVHNTVLGQSGGSVYVTDETDENRIFNSRLTYDKGAALVHLIRHWINDDALFHQSLQEYQTTFANATASAEDFIEVVEEVSEVDMTNFLEHWYYGEGYPTYSGKFNNTNDGVVIELSQISSMPNVTPFYESYLELKIDFLDGSDTIVRLKNTVNQQNYLVAISKEVYDVSVDPDNWILNREGVFAKDENLEYIPTATQSLLAVPIIVYPNPTNGKFYMDNIEGESGLEIFNSLGQLVFQQELKGGSNTIESDLQEGIYFIRIESSGKFYYNSIGIK